MHDRNRYMVDNAAYLVAVWTGIQTGTGMTVAYANELNRQVLCLNPEAATPGMYKVFFEVVSSEGKRYGASEMFADELRGLAGFVKQSLASTDRAVGAEKTPALRDALQKFHDMLEAAKIITSDIDS